MTQNVRRMPERQGVLMLLASAARTVLPLTLKLSLVGSRLASILEEIRRSALSRSARQPDCWYPSTGR